MEATFMNVWMGVSIKASLNFTRKQLPGFGCFHRVCRSNVRTFDGNGSRLYFRGSFHDSSVHGRLRGSRGYRATSPSTSSRQEDPSTEGSAIHHPWPTPRGGSTRNLPSTLPCYEVPNTQLPDAHVLLQQLSYRLYCISFSLNRPSEVERRLTCSARSYGNWARE